MLGHFKPKLHSKHTVFCLLNHSKGGVTS